MEKLATTWELSHGCRCAAEDQPASKVAAQAQELEAQAQGHAQAHSQLVVHAHNLTSKAEAHASAQVSLLLIDCVSLFADADVKLQGVDPYLLA